MGVLNVLYSCYLTPSSVGQPPGSPPPRFCLQTPAHSTGAGVWRLGAFTQSERLCYTRGECFRMKQKPTDYRNRIKALEYVNSADLVAHPGNWREHPAAQAEALKGVLSEVGIAGARYWTR